MEIPESNAAQARIWNEAAGRAWVDLASVLDHTFMPFEEMLVDWVAALPEAQRQQVLDIGCGTGATTLALAKRLPGQECTGIDISGPMIDLARTRARTQQIPANFVVGDAQSFPFADANVDVLVSRFGVMFFDDPVAAFAHLQSAVRDGGRIVFVCWRAPADNSFMSTAERVAGPLLPGFSPPTSGQPGPFAFADPVRVRHVLEESGWTGVTIAAVDAVCTMQEKDLMPYLTQMGPVGRMLSTVDENTRVRVVEALAEGHAQFVTDGEVRYTAACWLVSAASP